VSTPKRPETLGELIFDLAGTLADTLPVVVEALQKEYRCRAEIDFR
jgi:beta-phosphoglucomutase-like phosphatase (HAD superfamily)